MDTWKPRENDHLIEPFFAGLPGAVWREGGAREGDGAEAREDRRTLVAAAVVAVLLIVRFGVLIAR